MDTLQADDPGDEMEDCGVVVVREDDPETGETVVRKYPVSKRDHDPDS